MTRLSALLPLALSLFITAAAPVEVGAQGAAPEASPQTEMLPPAAVSPDTPEARVVPDVSPDKPNATAVPGKAPAAEAPQKPAFSLSADTEALQLTDDIKVARRQVKEHPDDPEAHFLLAAAYSRSPYLDKAFNAMKKVKNLLKVNQDFEFIDRTLGQYEELLTTSPNDPVILYRLAMAYYFKGYSVEKYPHHYKNGPTGSPGEFYTKAENTMRKVIALNPKDTWARNYLGYLVTENGKDLAKGIPIWQESLQIDDQTNPGAYLLLSQAYLKQGDLQKSLAYGAKGLAIQQTMGMRIP